MKRAWLGVFFLAGCAGELHPSPPKVPGWVAAASATLNIDLKQNIFEQVSLSSNRAVTFTVDFSKFKAPPITNAVLNFGTVAVTALSDSQLKVCGTGGTKKCVKAMLDVYTTGVAGAGLYNSTGGYGVPLFSTLTTPVSVGLGVTNAAVMQTVNIPSTKNTLVLSDFSPAPVYTITSDFTNAGAGTYSTTLVVELDLQ